MALKKIDAPEFDSEREEILTNLNNKTEKWGKFTSGNIKMVAFKTDIYFIVVTTFADSRNIVNFNVADLRTNGADVQSFAMNRSSVHDMLMDVIKATDEAKFDTVSE